MRRWRSVLVLTLAIGPVAALLGIAGAATGRQATPGADDASPAAGLDAVRELPPADVLDRLLTAPFAEDALPAGFKAPVVSAWEEGDTDLEGSLGGVVVNLAGNDGGGIAYVVFPDERAAVRRLAETTDQAVAQSRGAVVDRFDAVEVDGVTFPARLVVYPEYAVCLVRVGPVLVFGGADDPMEPAARREVAVALARAGVAHLLRLAAPAAPPEASAAADQTP